jgi:hypothetical protein
VFNLRTVILLNTVGGCHLLISTVFSTPSERVLLMDIEHDTADTSIGATDLVESATDRTIWELATQKYSWSRPKIDHSLTFVLNTTNSK